MSELILKEPSETADDFEHVKNLIFKRYKLSARALRLKLDNHAKRSDLLWSDLKYELQVYLGNWLPTVEVCDFDSLKELLLVEQLKKRVPAEIREHYIDVWEDIKDAFLLAEKCDRFEAVRKDYRRFEPRNFGRNSFKKSHKPFANNSERAEKEKKFDKNKEKNRERKPSEN